MLSRDNISKIQLTSADGKCKLFSFSTYFSSSFLCLYHIILFRMVFERLARFKVTFTKLSMNVLATEKCFAEVAT